MNPWKLGGFLSLSSPSGLPLIILLILSIVFPSLSKFCPEHLLFLCIIFSSGITHARGLNNYFLVAPRLLDPALISLFPMLWVTSDPLTHLFIPLTGSSCLQRNFTTSRKCGISTRNGAVVLTLLKLEIWNHPWASIHLLFFLCRYGRNGHLHSKQS